MGGPKGRLDPLPCTPPLTCIHMCICMYKYKYLYVYMYTCTNRQPDRHADTQTRRHTDTHSGVYVGVGHVFRYILTDFRVDAKYVHVVLLRAINIVALLGYKAAELR